jgi:hypothetical protein
MRNRKTRRMAFLADNLLAKEIYKGESKVRVAKIWFKDSFNPSNTATIFMLE